MACRIGSGGREVRCRAATSEEGARRAVSNPPGGVPVSGNIQAASVDLSPQSIGTRNAGGVKAG